jgi:hypothetical protein
MLGDACKLGSQPKWKGLFNKRACRSTRSFPYSLLPFAVAKIQEIILAENEAAPLPPDCG